MMHPLPIAFLMTLAACGHTAPSSAGPGDLEGPFQSTEPLRLTYSPGADRTPLWSIVPDRVMYAYDHEPVPGGVSGCVADLPVGGGSRGLELCDTDVDYAQTIMRPFWPARRPDGATAMIRQRWAPMGIAPFFSDLAIQPGGQGQVPRTILPIPYFSSATGRTHQGVSHLQWLDGDHLVYLALAVIRSQNDNVETGLEIVILTPADSISGVAVMPGTLYASSVAVGGNSDTLYYTMGGDSMVYRRTLSTDVVDTVADFGPLGIARDVQVRAGRLVAVVGGNVAFGPHAYLGMAQYDFGGLVYLIDLPDGTPTLLTDPLIDRYRHLALAPNGSRVVGVRNGDLWAIAVP